MEVQEIKDKLSALAQCIQSIEGEITMIQSANCKIPMLDVYASYGINPNLCNAYINSLQFPSRPQLVSYESNYSVSNVKLDSSTERHVVYGSNLAELIEKESKNESNAYFTELPTPPEMDHSEQHIRRRARSTSTTSTKSGELNEKSEFTSTNATAVKYTYGKTKKVNRSEDSADEDWTPEAHNSRYNTPSNPKRSKRLQQK